MVFMSYFYSILIIKKHIIIIIEVSSGPKNLSFYPLQFVQLIFVAPVMFSYNCVIVHICYNTRFVY